MGGQDEEEGVSCGADHREAERSRSSSKPGSTVGEVSRKLLNGCELTTEEGQKYLKENDLLKKKCVPCVQSVVEILENIKMS